MKLTETLTEKLYHDTEPRCHCSPNITSIPSGADDGSSSCLILQR